jgi:chaperonin GroEL (HSP60 family)
MGSKGIGSDDEKKSVAKLVSDAVTQVAEDKDGKYVVDLDLIKIEKKAGGEVLDSSLIKGVLVDKEVVHTGMPKSVKEAKVLLLDTALEIEKTETDAKIEITSPENMEAFLQQEEKMMKEMVEKIAATNANVVFCQKGIDDLVQHYLSKKKIMAVRRVKKSDMEKLSRATGGIVASSLEDLKEEDLGSAGVVQEKKVGGEAMVFVEKCKDPKSVTIFRRGGTDHVVSEVERAVVDSRGAVASALEDGKYVIGGGSIEMEISKEISNYAIEIGGREQLAIQGFADALECIPKALSENAGMDVIDTIVTLKNKHKEKDGKTVGVDVIAGKVGDLKAQGIFEPARVKKQAMASATETARLVLRIDDIISSKGGRGGAGGPPGMPPGMGGMGME